MKKVLFKFIGVIGMVIGLSLITGYAQAQVDVNILGYSISPTNPQPNQAFSLSVTITPVFGEIKPFGGWL